MTRIRHILCPSLNAEETRQQAKHRNKVTLDCNSALCLPFFSLPYLCNGVVVERRRTLTQAAELVKMETTAGVRQQSGFICSAADNFSAHPKSSLARIDKRTARAARNTRYRYNKIGPLDHKMADNCVSLARTNTVSSTITTPINTRKT